MTSKISCSGASALLAAALAMGGAASAQAATPVVFGPTAYLSAADIPAGFYASGEPTLLEDFEDRRVDGRLAISRGNMNGIGIVGNGANSVDGDDGSIDGRGVIGTSWTVMAPASRPLRFTFIGNDLPTAFGLVVTAGGFSTTFSAYDAAGALIATRSADLLVQNTGVVSGDRFFGVQYADGIRAVEVSFGGGWIDVDHVQFGVAAAVPEPGSWALMLGGALALGLRLQRRRIRA